MATQNFTCTAGTAKSENFTDATAAANDDVFCIVYESGAAKITKRTAHYGGSSDEIEVDAGVKYILKLTAAETQNLASGATYKLVKYASGTFTELFTGTITVSGASSSITQTTLAQSVSCTTQKFTENAKFDISLESNKIITGFKIVGTTTDSNGNISIGLSEGDGTFLGDIGTPFPIQGDVVIYYPMPFYTITTDNLPADIWVSCGDWDGAEAEITAYYI